MMNNFSVEGADDTLDVPPAQNTEQNTLIFQHQSKNNSNSRSSIQKQIDKQKLAQAPIGVFDSGAGGLTILSALRERLPAEQYLYLGDTAYCPYGVRSEEEITALSIQNCQFLINQGVKLIVVACNTASQAALSSLRETFPHIPFIGVVPAVKPAAKLTRNGRIGIAATNSAAKSAYLQHLIQDFAADISAYAVGCSELVTLVERGELDNSQVEQTLRTCLRPLMDQHIDVLVLGCTHFPALRTAIERVVGKDVSVIDSSAAIARRTETILKAEDLIRLDVKQEQAEERLFIWCTGDASNFTAIASAVLGYPVTAQQAIL